LSEFPSIWLEYELRLKTCGLFEVHPVSGRLDRGDNANAFGEFLVEITTKHVE
jgi:hypothetical protein